MELRWKIAIGLMVLGIGFAMFVSLIDVRGKRVVAEVRQALRQEGFKTDLSEFDFTTSPELRQREQVLTNADFGWNKWGNDFQRRSLLNQETPNLMKGISEDAALVVWRQERLPSQEGENLWPRLRELFNDDRKALDAATTAALSGPIRFELNASHGMAMLLRHLAALKTLATTLGQRAMVDLHDGDAASAWTNLLTTTRLVTAWEVEPTEVSHLVRFANASIVFNITWQLLQKNAWSDEQLAQLQREWEAVDYFKGLPETVAFKRAGSVAACELERRAPIFDGMKLWDMVRYPRSAWEAIQYYWRRRDYRLRGVFEDEKALYYHFRDREIEVRNAIQCASWLQMRLLPGVTNIVPFQTTNSSRVAVMLNQRHLIIGFQGLGQTLLGRAAEAEMRRRLVITALALERFHRKHGFYPSGLTELAPEFVKSVPADFADEQPLRYRRTDDGRFVLYSIGLNCVDDGGRMPEFPEDGYVSDRSVVPGWLQKKSDLVWPRPANNAEIESFFHRKMIERKNQLDEMEDSAAEWRWEETARRQSRVEKSLRTDSPPTNDPQVKGRALSELLRNETTAGTNRLSMRELLTLKQVATGAEPETVTFELPIAHDALTNLGELYLLIDPFVEKDEDVGDAGCNVASLNYQRATNGNTLLVWDTIYETPGQHALQPGLLLAENFETEISGPLHPFVSSNFCQFSAESAVFNPEIGATLRAKLPEANAQYSMEISSPAGQRLKTISGSTTNGIIKVFWDLLDEQGVRCAEQSFGTVFHVTLTDSERTQTMRGP